MKKHFACVLAALTGLGYMAYAQSAQSAKPKHADIKIIFIRHGEKPEKGGNLTCKGLNRSLMLPAVINQKFGVPDYVYVPSLKLGKKTSHARMFETATPLAVKYNLDINSKYEEKDSTGLADDILKKQGTVLVVWEHKAINTIIHALGVAYNTVWKGDDFNTIIIITFKGGKATLSTDTEGLNPSDDCPN